MSLWLQSTLAADYLKMWNSFLLRREHELNISVAFHVMRVRETFDNFFVNVDLKFPPTNITPSLLSRTTLPS